MSNILSLRQFSRVVMQGLACAGCLLTHPAVIAQGLTIPRVSNAPLIDGRLGVAEWSQATRVQLDTEFSPTDGIPARVKTEALIMEDGDSLYVAFRAQDPNPGAIRAFFRDRDQIGGTDFAGIALDTFNDEARAFIFLVSPLGVQYDAINDDLSGEEDDSWNALWESEGRIDDAGYVVEMAIPFKQLRFPSGVEEKTWGVRFIRD